MAAKILSCGKETANYKCHIVLSAPRFLTLREPLPFSLSDQVVWLGLISISELQGWAPDPGLANHMVYSPEHHDWFQDGHTVNTGQEHTMEWIS